MTNHLFKNLVKLEHLKIGLVWFGLKHNLSEAEQILNYFPKFSQSSSWQYKLLPKSSKEPEIIFLWEVSEKDFSEKYKLSLEKTLYYFPVCIRWETRSTWISLSQEEGALLNSYMNFP